MISRELADKLEFIMESMDPSMPKLYNLIFQRVKAIQTYGEGVENCKR